MYKPKRDSRFEYVFEVFDFIETRQCRKCVYGKTEGGTVDEEFPMCNDVAEPLLLEKPVEELDDVGPDGVVCTKFTLHDNFL